MIYLVYDYWANRPVIGGLSYREAKAFAEENEPPFNARVGQRYGYWPDETPQSSEASPTDPLRDSRNPNHGRIGGLRQRSPEEKADGI